MKITGGDLIMATIDRDVKFTLTDLEQDDIDLLYEGLESLAKTHGSKNISEYIIKLKQVFYPHIT